MYGFDDQDTDPPDEGEVRWYRAVLDTGDTTVRTEAVRGNGPTPPVPPFLDGVASFQSVGVTDIGSPSDELGRDPGESWRQVEITGPYFLGYTEVTIDDWRDMYGVNPPSSGTCTTLDCPVENITFESALDYCNQLSLASDAPLFETPCYELSGCTGSAALGTLSCSSVGFIAGVTSVEDCEGFRLPTDAEWEAAYRMGSRESLYEGPLTVTGSTSPDPVLELIGWYAANSTGFQEVGLLEPTYFDLYDMSGNVAEFVWDGFAGVDSLPTLDPEGGPDPAGQIVRNCSALDPAEYCRAGFRRSVAHGVQTPGFGFRIAANTPAPPGGGGPP